MHSRSRTPAAPALYRRRYGHQHRRRASLCPVLPMLVLLALAALPAAPAPPRYVTPNYGVHARIPPGLYHCPLPDGWEGTDHGVNLYLVRPPNCGDADATPHIGLYYEYNVAEFARPDGTAAPPRTAAELRRMRCHGTAAAPAPAAVRLAGQTVLPCVERAGRHILVTASTLYDIGPPQPGQPPGETLALTLATTPARLPRDLRTFRRLLAATTLCTPRWATPTPGKPACREHPGSWW